MSVEQLMTKNPSAVGPEDSLATAAERMWSGDCGALPVVNHDGIVVAMVTDRDICMASWSRNRAPAELRVEDAMSRGLVVCRPTDPLESAEGAMRTAQVRRLPVVDESNRLLGIISVADIAVDGHRAQRAASTRSTTELVATLAMICAKPLANDAASNDAPSGESGPATASEPTAARGEASPTPAREASDGRAA